MGVVINGCAHSGSRNLELAVSHKEINGINWFFVFWYKFRNNYTYFNNWNPVLQRVLQNRGCLSVFPSVWQSICQFSIFPRHRNSFFWYLARWYIIGIFKNWQSLFPRKFHFFPNLRKKDQNDPMVPNRIFRIFFLNILSLVFLVNNLKWKLILLLILQH